MNEDLKNILQLAKALNSKALVSKDEMALVLNDVVNALAQYRSATKEINKQTTETLNSTLLTLQDEFEKVLENVRKENAKLKIDKMRDDILTEVREIMPKDGDPGKDADEDAITEKILSQVEKTTPEGVRNLLESLEDEERLDASAIKNLPEATQKIVEMVRGGGNVEVFSGNNKVGSSQRLKFTGATVTNDPDGAVRVTISAASAIGTEVPTGLVDDTNTVFTFTTAPKLVIVNGSTYRNGSTVGGAVVCTIAGTTVTLAYPVGTGGDIFGII